MYRYKKAKQTSLEVNKGYQGETIEAKVNRIVNNKEPIEDSAPLIYTDRKEGVLPDYNPRADRWDHALDAMDAVAKSHRAKRLENLKAREEAQNTKETAGQSTQGTEGNTGAQTPKP